MHRDIKPENILFREDGTPVLTDFGIARAVDRGASLTVAGMMVGTPSYMSPEQVKGVELDGRSDLYSLGIVCYEMLTGTVPFRADSTMSTAIKHLIEPIPPLPADLARYQPFITRLTAKDRNDRFATGYDAVQALRSIARKSATGRGHDAAANVSRDQGNADQTAATPLCRVRDGHDQQRGDAHGLVGFAPLGREAASA